MYMCMYTYIITYINPSLSLSPSSLPPPQFTLGHPLGPSFSSPDHVCSDGPHHGSPSACHLLLP